MRTAICINAWPFAEGEPLVKGAEYRVRREYFYNGEHWMVLAKDDKKTVAPSVFFHEVR